MGKTYRRNSDYRPRKGNGRDNINEITRLKKKGKKKHKRLGGFGAPAAGFPPDDLVDNY
jgi:hypothetical protein